MRLTLLDPRWVRYETRVEDVQRVASGFETSSEAGLLIWKAAGRPVAKVVAPVEYVHEVDSASEAQGLWFLCPACFVKNNGPIGTHSLQATLRGRGAEDHQGSQSQHGGPSRWCLVSGSSFDDVTLSPSIDCGCWHGHIINGEATS